MVAAAQAARPLQADFCFHLQSGIRCAHGLLCRTAGPSASVGMTSLGGREDGFDCRWETADLSTTVEMTKGRFVTRLCGCYETQTADPSTARYPALRSG